MGFLQEGQWVDQWYNTKKTDGRFIRNSPQFRNWITSERQQHNNCYSAATERASTWRRSSIACLII